MWLAARDHSRSHLRRENVTPFCENLAKETQRVLVREYRQMTNGWTSGQGIAADKSSNNIKWLTETNRNL